MSSSYTPIGERVTPRVFAEHQLVRRDADVFGLHDLVGELVLQHAVLMDSGFVRERVVADDWLVGRDRLSDDLRQQARGRVDLARVDARTHAHQVVARLHGHHDFFQRAVARALADSVDGAFDLTRAVAHRGQRICDSQAEIVVAVRTPDNFVGAWNFFPHVREHPAKFLGDRVTGGVGQIDHGRAGADYLTANVHHVIPVGARRVLAGELDVVEMLFCAGDGPGCGVEHVLAIHVEFVLEMDFRGRDKNVNPGMRGFIHGAQSRIYILFAGARETQHDGFGERLCDAADRLEVAGRGDGKAGLDDIHVQAFELTRERDLLLDVHRATGRLLAVA